MAGVLDDWHDPKTVVDPVLALRLVERDVERLLLTSVEADHGNGDGFIPAGLEDFEALMTADPGLPVCLFQTSGSTKPK